MSHRSGTPSAVGEFSGWVGVGWRVRGRGKLGWGCGSRELSVAAHRHRAQVALPLAAGDLAHALAAHGRVDDLAREEVLDRGDRAHRVVDDLFGAR